MPSAASRIKLEYQRNSAPAYGTSTASGIAAFFGGYPGAAGLGGDDERWRSYVLDSLVETTSSRDLPVAAHLLNHGLTPTYWRDRNREVDFVVETPQAVTAMAVTSGPRKDALPGFDAFLLRVPEARPLLVGAQGVPLEEFFGNPPERWLG